MIAIRFKHVGFGLVLAGCATAVAACGSSDAGTGPSGGTGGAFQGSGGGFGTGGGTVAPGGATGSGGATVAAGGATGSGGATVAAGGTTGAGGTTTVIPASCNAPLGNGVVVSTDIKISGSNAVCGTPPAVPQCNLAPCSSDKQCTAAHCVPQAGVPSSVSADLQALLGKCADGSLCIPDDYIATSGQFKPKVCTSIGGAEGRCISKCIPQVSVQLTTLPKDVCADSELCAPCFNPIDGTDTKACGQNVALGCDTAPDVAKKVVFDPCGAPAGTNPMPGVCVPSSLVTDPVQQAALKSVDDPNAKCTKTDANGAYVCAPTLKAKDQSANFPVCTPTTIAALLALKNAAGQAGGCVPSYIVPSTKNTLVAQDGCQTGELCAPCTDPLNNQAPTGACPWP